MEKLRLSKDDAGRRVPCFLSLRLVQPVVLPVADKRESEDKE
jgi:hypothetical protein